MYELAMDISKRMATTLVATALETMTFASLRFMELFHLHRLMLVEYAPNLASLAQRLVKHRLLRRYGFRAPEKAKRSHETVTV